MVAYFIDYPIFTKLYIAMGLDYVLIISDLSVL